MSYPGDPYYRPERSGFVRFLEVISASFRLGRFFRVEVRVFWLTIIIMPLIFLSSFGPWMSTAEALTHTVIWTLLLYVVIWSHEMGHIWMGRRYGMHTPLITLSPIGGLAHMASPAPRPSAEAWVAAAGPATHLVWLAVFAPLWYFVLGQDWTVGRPDGWFFGPISFAIYYLVVINFFLMVFNLLPFFPMDGGRILRALLSNRMNPNRATMIATQIGIIGAVLFMVSPIFFTFFGEWWLLFVIGLSNLFACLQERKAARYGMSPYDATAQLDPWQSDPDAWKRGSSFEAEEPGFFQRRKEAREQRKREREYEERESLEQEVDRILAKVSEVGMGGLTEKEKRTLMRASEERKKR
ncbi:MAG: site-2 protease family protein [Planctomycetota bacterium]|nr:site-2 protease family protein [Planctomycetota bacterium]